MKLLRPVARALVGSFFVTAGLDVLRAPGGRVQQAAPTLEAIRDVVPLPEDDELLVRVNAAAQVACGLALALGIRPKLAALVLAGSLVPTTFAGHPFWTIDDPTTRKAQRAHFGKNVAMLGGLLYELSSD